MKLIKNAEFGGERPLFESHDLRLENVIIRTGESAIKECSNIEAVDCRFEGNYPFWHVHGFKIDRCYFDVGGRSALWYSDHLKMTDTIIDAPKMFREMDEIGAPEVSPLRIHFDIQIDIAFPFIYPQKCFFTSFNPHQLPVRITKWLFFIYIIK